MGHLRYLMLITLLALLVACQPKKQEEADVGVGSLAEVGFKASSQDLEMSLGRNTVEVHAIETWVRVLVSHNDGLQTGDLLTFVNFFGTTVNYTVSDLYDSAMRPVTSVAKNEFAYLPYQNGIFASAAVNDQIQGTRLGTVNTVTTYLKLIIQSPDGLKSGDAFTFVNPDGTTVNYTVGTLYTNEMEIALPTDVTVGEYAYVPYVSGVMPLAEGYERILPLDLTNGHSDPTIGWSVTQYPIHGHLYGTAPDFIYAPDPNFVGVDRLYFTATDAKGKLTRGTISIKVDSSVRVIYLCTTGNDLTAEVDNVAKPFLTTQAAINAAMKLQPSLTKNVVINVGPRTVGDFGNAVVTSDFGQFVSWVGTNSTSKVGTISGVGDNALAADLNGSPGPNIIIDSDLIVTFKNVTSIGGNAGSAVTRDTFGGAAGAITFKGKGSILSTSPGTGTVLSTGQCLASSGGLITVAEGATVTSVSAVGAGSCEVNGNGGSVVVIGTVNGSVTASGGSGAAFPLLSTGGKGGTVVVNGLVTGIIQAQGGNGSSAAGMGGDVTINGTVASVIYAVGGNSTNGSGGAGGIVTVNESALASTISAYGGQGTSGGAGGSVALHMATAEDLYVAGGVATALAGPAGAGGTITVGVRSAAGTLNATGGVCNVTNPGKGGKISISTSATATYTAGSVLGGTCTGSANVGVNGTIKSI